MTYTWKGVASIGLALAAITATAFSASQCVQYTAKMDSEVRKACFDKAPVVEDCMYQIKYGATRQ